MSFDKAIATVMQQRIAEERVRAVTALTNAQCKDFSEYRYACGYIKCLDDMAVIAGETIEDIQGS